MNKMNVVFRNVYFSQKWKQKQSKKTTKKISFIFLGSTKIDLAPMYFLS